MEASEAFRAGNDILKLIVLGFHNVNIKINNNNSIFTFLKIEYTEKMEDFIYNKHIRERGDKIEDIVTICC